ncbi:MAG: hypothetical protein PWP51_1294 [Clostridiales bacterium]|jgi:hypothetical protein|nr:hypothetical protein [Clostridiales bacterium]MDN5298741.1 hypothetical protein [Clostridiales bacterium]
MILIRIEWGNVYRERKKEVSGLRMPPLLDKGFAKIFFYDFFR